MYIQVNEYVYIYLCVCVHTCMYVYFCCLYIYINIITYKYLPEAAAAPSGNFEEPRLRGVGQQSKAQKRLHHVIRKQRYHKMQYNAIPYRTQSI